MSQHVNVVEECGIVLPASAPQIRVTAGYGSAGQKTWNLRRPVTLVGSKRPAHIVLHDRDISVAHCAIINTGADVLLFDLHTSSGTGCNKDRICLAALKDGDVITIGDTKIQVAIRMPTGDADDSGYGVEFVEPTRFRNPLTLSLIHADKQWTVEEAAVLIGRHDQAAIRLDNQEISTRHAILFRFGGGPAVFDLGSRSGVWVNGQRCEISVLADGDRLTIGPFGLGVCAPDRKPSPSEISNLKSQISKPAEHTGGAAAPAASEQEAGELRLDPLQNNITEAWQRLNHWRTQLQRDANLLGERQDSLASREAELDARDAALRGQLHDITRFNEQLAQREGDLSARAAQIQADADAVAALKKAAAERDVELQRRIEEVSRRENVLAQRWSRIQSTTCPHCRKPINVGSASPSETG
jgi:pSer/pThr/pTyr-binding forkhead associated (FHA) protein